MLLDKLKVEFIGTFLCTFFTGMGLVLYRLQAEDVNALMLSVFVIFTICCWAARLISMGQFNPAVSLALVVSRHQKPRSGLFIAGTQVIACISAVSVLLLCVSPEVVSIVSQNAMIGLPVSQRGFFVIFASEAFGTFLVVFAFYALVVERNSPKHVYAPALGGLYAVLTKSLLGSSGAVLSPARTIAYVLASRNVSNIAPLLLGQVLGLLLGAVLGNLILSEKAEITRVRRKSEKRARRESQVKNIVKGITPA